MNFPVCDLSNAVNPGMYIVVTTDKEHALEVENLEKSMAKEMLDYDDSDLEPKMCVAVKNFRGKLNRGIIENKITKDLYEVFLVDYGKIVQAHRTAIIVIKNKSFLKVEPLAFIVKLHGVIPAKYFSFGDTGQVRACKDWAPEAHTFIDNFFKLNSKVVVQSILIQHRTVYGDLFVKDHSTEKYVSLRKILCKNKFCAYSLSSFLKREELTVSSEVVEMSAKMEMVKKWQLENFGEFKPGTYRLPSPRISPHCSISDVTTLHLSESQSSGGQRTEPPQGGPLAVAEKHGTIPEKPGVTPGLGRGNLRLMIAEMKEKEKAAAMRSDSPVAAEGEAPKSTRGRGYHLRRVLDTIKARTLEPGPSQAKVETEGERVTDVETGNTGTVSCSSVYYLPTKVERAVVKPGEFSEFSYSPTEVSLQSTEEDPGPPPLVRNSTVKSNFKNSVLNGGQSVCRNEIGKGDSKSSCEGLNSNCKGMGKRSPDERQETNSDCWNPNESWCCETNWCTWQQSSNLMANNCWTPFVLFDDSVVDSISNFGDLPIQPSIIKNLERRGTFKSPSQVQRWAIPTIRKQQNTVLIGGPKTGKTLSYLIPLMDYVQDECYFEELSRGNGPSVVIVASSAHVCESIYYTCHYLLGHMHQKDIAKSMIKVVMAHGSGCEKEIWVNLTNGCDVLICTPPCLVRLSEFTVLTNFDRLSCLVLDEADIICENPFMKSVRIILEKTQMSTKGRHYQKIFCGEKWTPNMEMILKAYVKSYSLVMGSYSEAVIYKRLKPRIFLVEKEKKAEMLVERLKDKMQKGKVLIFCEATAEAIALFNFLNQKGITSLLAHEKILAEGLKEREQIWKNSANSVLIITDGVLGELNIRDAQVLIHYDLPSQSKTNFFLRYSTVMNSYQKKHNFQKKETQRLAQEVHTVILIDDHNHYQLPHIVEFVTRLGEELPQEIVERCEDIRRMIEVGKRTAPVCGNLLAFGRCRNWRNCPRRHALVKAYDSPKDLPTSGLINFEVVKTLDASLLSARLLEHIDFDGVSTKFDNSHFEIEQKLAEYFKEEGNRRPLGSPKIGTVCAVLRTLDEKELFHRGRVIEYLKVDKHNMPLEVSVKLLDEGDLVKRKVANMGTELYELPPDLAQLPATAIDVRLLGLQPNDFDVSWSQVADAFFEHLMTPKLEPNQYWSAQILLALNNTLLVNPVKRKQFLPQLNIHIFDMVVHKELLSSRIAMPNQEHLPSLVKLFKEAGMDPPKKQERKKCDSARIQPQWAFFDSDVIEVRFMAAENTSVVFLQPKKNEKLLKALEQDCQQEGGKREKEREKTNAVGPTCTVGEFCLARFEDGHWNRGRIESDNDTKWYVFFIDHGDFLLVLKQDVVPISETLLLRLPCQAIECRLAGIEDVEECPLSVLQEMYAFSEDGKRELYAHVVRKEAKGTITGGRKYDVNLVDRKGVSLNKLLVDCEMMRGRESERCFLEDKEVQAWTDEECSEGDDGEEEEEMQVQPGEQLNGEYSPDSHLAHLGDDVFEGEEGLEFLKEFASKLFRGLNGFEETPKTTQQKKGKEEECTRPAPQSPEMKKIHRLQELQKKRRDKNKGVLQLKNREVLTPQVLWCQTQEVVRLRILLGNVSDYSVECTYSNFSFRCLLGEKFYAVDLKLFGAVNPPLMKVWTKAFHVSVVLAKVASPTWPRLPLDEGKHRWISLDVEGLKDQENDFSDKIKKAKREIESGDLRKGTRSEMIHPYSDTDDSDEKSNSDTEDSDEDI